MASSGPLTIAVLIKQVPDMNAIRIDRATGRIVPSPQLVMSSYDEYAVEAALGLKNRSTARSSLSPRVRRRCGMSLRARWRWAQIAASTSKWRMSTPLTR